MGISRDRRAPTELTEDQKLEIRNNLELVQLRKDRKRYKDEIYRRKYDSMEAAKGMDLYDQYKCIEHKISSTSNKLHRKQLN